MGRESRNISREELAGFIDSASKKEEVEIKQAEQLVIDQIISSFPEYSEKKNSASIGKWCNNQVDQILKAHPELEPQAEKIRQRVRMEFVYRFHEAEFSHLREEINTKKPTKVTPIWVRQNARRVAGIVNRNHLSWQLVAEKIETPIEEQPSSFEDVMKRVNAKLKKQNPSVIGPKYFQNNLSADFLYFRRNIVDTQGMVDWDKILANLEEEFQSRWNKRAVYEEARPMDTYRDEDELNQFLDIHKDKLFTVIEASPDDRQSREEVIQGLIRLAKKGNDSAFEKAVEYLEFIVQSWMIEKRLPAKLSNHKSEVDDRIKRSIYLYRNSGPYLTYLFVSLVRLGKGLKSLSIVFNEDQSEHNLSNRNGKRNGKNIPGNGDHFPDEPTDEF